MRWTSCYPTPIIDFAIRNVLRQCAAAFALLFCLSSPGSATEIKGDLLKWHKVIILFDGPNVKEEPATFRNYRLNVIFTKGTKKFAVPGHFAADGNAAQTGAGAGNKWRVLFTPNETGTWSYQVSFRTGTDVAVSPEANAGSPLAPLDGEVGTFTIGLSDKQAPDFRARGLLRYTGKHFQQFAEDDSYWLAIGPGSPENFFGGSEIDSTRVAGQGMPVQFYPDHQQDWKTGDPLWRGGNGKGLIGALNYLKGIGQTSMFVCMMNAGYDGNDTWPYTGRDTTVSGKRIFTVNGMSIFDVSKLDQWEIIVSHAQKNGIAFHAYFGEEESESLFEFVEGLPVGGSSSFAKLRKLYYRELVSRLGHFNAIDWNIGEELGGLIGITNQPYGFPVISRGQIKLFADYVRALDPYGHSVGFEGDQDRTLQDYGPWFGGMEFDRAAIQGYTPKANWYSIALRDSSKARGRPWVINFSEHHTPEPVRNMSASDLIAFRKSAWGTFLGGGAGLEWWLSQDDYFLTSYRPYGTLMVETAHVRDFMLDYLPFWQMEPANNLLAANSGYCFALKGQIYAAYVNNAGSVNLNLSGVTGAFNVYWYDPRTGGALKNGTVTQVQGGSNISLGQPPSGTGSDWTVLVRNTDYTGIPDLKSGYASGRDVHSVDGGRGISLTLNRNSKIDVTLHSLNGQLLRHVFKGTMAAGCHRISLCSQGTGSPSAAQASICIVRLLSEGQNRAVMHTIKMVK